MDKSIPNHLRNAVVAASSAIPLVGGPISVLLDKYLPDYIQRKRDEFLESVGIGLSELEDKFSPDELHSERFLSIFIKGTHQAIAEHSEEKIDCLRNIILNSAIEPGESFDERSLFLRMVQDLTEDQIKLLKAVGNLSLNPRPTGCLKLAGTSYYRIRCGNYRIIYDIQDKKLVIIVLKIGYRKTVYRRK